MASKAACHVMEGLRPHERPLLQIAPMMEVTYRDFRYFIRLLTRRTQLWTEMVVDDTVLHNLEPAKCDRFLGFHEVEHPIVCQLGGSDPSKLAAAAEVAQRYGYDEVNLNVGCPSCRVANKGEFGCSLMKRKEVVRDAIHAMSRSVQIPVTVKCRLGVDDFDSQEFTRDFVRTVAQGGCKHFIIHARKAWLNGLSPAQNRTIPPLHYPRILDLCKEFPDLNFSINGGIADVGHARALLGFPNQRMEGETDDLYAAAWDWETSQGSCPVPSNLLGVMIGRGAMNTPCMLWDVDHTIYGGEKPEPVTRRQLLEKYRLYLEETHEDGNKAFRNTADAVMRKKAGLAAAASSAASSTAYAVDAVVKEALLFFAIMPQEAGLEALGRHRPAAGAGEDVFRSFGQQAHADARSAGEACSLAHQLVASEGHGGRTSGSLSGGNILAAALAAGRVANHADRTAATAREGAQLCMGILEDAVQVNASALARETAKRCAEQALHSIEAAIRAEQHSRSLREVLAHTLSAAELQARANCGSTGLPSEALAALAASSQSALPSQAINNVRWWEDFPLDQIGPEAIHNSYQDVHELYGSLTQHLEEAARRCALAGDGSSFEDDARAVRALVEWRFGKAAALGVNEEDVLADSGVWNLASWRAPLGEAEAGDGV
ncbi:unnamed protein product [Effrenium voratum]|nr:unnamed protein product [Effrenium voratum]